MRGYKPSDVTAVCDVTRCHLIFCSEISSVFINPIFISTVADTEAATEAAEEGESEKKT